MTLTQMNYIITISETGSLNKAAEALYISQPSLTNAVKELEKELGIIIFNRSGRGVTLTNDGTEFLMYARQIYGQYESVVEKYSEGEAASVYFSVFDELILQQKKDFFFHGRNKRPPVDKVNALLSFTYTLLTNIIVSALETVGLDPCVGYLHTERPGRASLALDMIEEFRAVWADRFVLSLINKRMINGKQFKQKENGAVLMDDDLRKQVLTEWQNKKKEVITHPFLGEKVEWGMLPYVQAMLLARYLRGDLDAYPPFLWK